MPRSHGWIFAAAAVIRASTSTTRRLRTKALGLNWCGGRNGQKQLAFFMLRCPHSSKRAERRSFHGHGILRQLERPSTEISWEQHSFPCQCGAPRLTLASSETLAQSSGLNSHSPAATRKNILPMSFLLKNGCFPERRMNAINPTLHMSTDCAFDDRFRGRFVQLDAI